MAVLREAMLKNPQLKLILMSATLDTELFLSYFDNSCHIQVPGRMFPVGEFYLEDILVQVDYKFASKKKQESKERKIDPFDLEEILIELPEIQSKQFDQAIESAFRFGDFDAIYKLIYEEDLPVDYQVSVFTDYDDSWVMEFLTCG